jgi:hypothetical protein
MDKNIPLLFDPPYILHPDAVLQQSFPVDTYHRKENKSLVECESCGKPLGSLYYIIFGIPPSPLMVEAFPCESIDNEKDIEKLVMSDIQSRQKR